MTYCVALQLNSGLVFMSDTRTNGGVDNINKFRKMYTWSVPGDRVITILSAGNLATTQAVISHLEDRMKLPEYREPILSKALTMFEVAQMVGEILADVIRSSSGDSGQQAASAFNATLIVGGQISTSESRIFMIYPEGNFIEASEDTPYFQLGETKYGRPILVRAFDQNMSFEDAVKMLLLSFDSTIKANLSVSAPLDLMYYENNSLQVTYQHRFEEDDPYLLQVSHGWGDALKMAFDTLPNFAPYGTN
ncbi:MAG: peptidase [Rhodomicrobium sp.]|nr:MAG: peptidase [Rhodomicrobium sp.]